MHGHGEYKMPGGKLVVADVAIADGRLAQVVISGDFFLEPDEALAAINAALVGQAGDADPAMLVRLQYRPACRRMRGCTGSAPRRWPRRCGARWWHEHALARP